MKKLLTLIPAKGKSREELTKEIKERLIKKSLLKKGRINQKKI